MIITNKTTSIRLDEEKFVMYSDLLIGLLNKPVEAGYSTMDMRRDFKIIDKLESALDTIDLEDSEFAHLKSLFSNAKYHIRHKDLIEFEDYILSL